MMLSGPSEKEIDFSIFDAEEDGENGDFMLPPLVICYGPAKASFIPYARPSKRIFDQEMHEAITDLYWSPDQFYRAPGSAASSVAIALARLDGQVEFMGKLGRDSLGKDMWSELKAYDVQMRCTKIDDSSSTAVSFMKLTAAGGRLKAKCVSSCAEDAFLNSDINLDVLKEVSII
jgi:sugar/nucleoside kinase (ribokinase family)